MKQKRSEKVYEHQNQNEGVFLATLMEEPDFLGDCLVTTENFINPKHQVIFDTMQSLFKEGERPTYHVLLQQDKLTLDKMGGGSYLIDVHSSFLSKENFKYQQEVLLRFSATEKSRRIAYNFLENSEWNNRIEDITSLISELEPYETATLKPPVTFSDEVKKRVKEHDESPAKGFTGVNTGFLNLNLTLNGWQPSKLHIIAARPSVGKTAFVLNAAYKSQKNNVFSTFFSLETSTGDIIDRILSSSTRLNLGEVKQVNRYLAYDSDKYQRYTEGVAFLESMKMDVKDDVFDIPSMKATVRENMRRYPNMNHVVFIDYLTLINAPSKNGNRRDLEVEAIANGLKDIAKTFNIPVVCLSQLSRAVESRNDKRPTMADIRDSGGIEQIADLIAFLYRDDYQEQGESNTSTIEFIIRKNRDGKIKTLPFQFNKTTQEYIDLNA